MYNVKYTLFLTRKGRYNIGLFSVDILKLYSQREFLTRIFADIGSNLPINPNLKYCNHF